MGARKKFSRGGQNHRHFKKLTGLRRVVQKIDHFAARLEGAYENFCVFCTVLDLNIGYESMASAEGASENSMVFCRTAAYDVIFFQIPGGGKCPPCPSCGRPWQQRGALVSLLSNFDTSHPA